MAVKSTRRSKNSEDFRVNENVPCFKLLDK